MRIEITFSFGSVQIYCYYVQKNCLFWALCRNITLHSGPGTRGYLDSRAGPFLGYVKKYWFFGEIFTSERTRRRKMRRRKMMRRKTRRGGTRRRTRYGTGNSSLGACSTTCH